MGWVFYSPYRFLPDLVAGAAKILLDDELIDSWPMGLCPIPPTAKVIISLRRPLPEGLDAGFRVIV